MFHARDNIFFGRTQDGSVRILKLAPLALQDRADHQGPITVTENFPAHLVEFDMTLDQHAWASVVASVSAQGEGRSRYFEALAFHRD